MQSIICADYLNQFTAHSVSNSWFSALSSMKKITELLIRSLVLFEKSKKLLSAFEKQSWQAVMYFHNVLEVVKTLNFLNSVVEQFLYKTFT